MAKKSAVEKQKRREKIVNQNWEKRQELKKIVRDLNVSEEEKTIAREKLNRLPRDASPIRLRNRCQLTGHLFLNQKNAGSCLCAPRGCSLTSCRPREELPEITLP